jgi:hypothetical protein
MNRLFSIYEELADLAETKLDLRSAIDRIEKDIAIREAFIIPAGGWPGSNADSRKTAQQAARAADEELKYLENEMEMCKADMLRVDMERDNLIAERSAWEWSIRDRETTRPVEGHKLSVFEEMERYQADQADTERKQDERMDDDAAASVRLFQMDELAAGCAWELTPYQLTDENKAARKRHEELMSLQNDYETKYGM